MVDSTRIQASGYPIFLNQASSKLQDFVLDLNPSQAIVLTDRIGEAIYLKPFIEKIPFLRSFEIIAIEAGETNKNLASCEKVWDLLKKKAVDRKALLINIGGGVVCDLGAFCAAIFKRGLRFIQVPTTLLSQVDASIGGKTGVDYHGIKNMLGTFSNPEAVFIENSFLHSLPPEQICSGAAEMIKHGLIADVDYYQALSKGLSGAIEKKEIPQAWIYRSLVIKNEMVAKDPFEAGERKLLNFGHTVGHAFESYCLEAGIPITHGHAIAMGMVCESYLSVTQHLLEEKTLYAICRFLTSVYAFASVEPSVFAHLYEIMLNDKKNSAGRVQCTLLNGIGTGTYGHEIEKAPIIQSLRFLNEIIQNKMHTA